MLAARERRAQALRLHAGKGAVPERDELQDTGRIHEACERGSNGVVGLFLHRDTGQGTQSFFETSQPQQAFTLSERVRVEDVEGLTRIVHSEAQSVQKSLRKRSR